MTLSKLALSLTEQDINAGLSTAFAKLGEGPQGEALKKVKDPRVSLKDGKLIFKCKASMGFLPVPVEAQIRLAPAQGGTALDITLAKLSLAMIGGDMIAGQLMGQLADAVAGSIGLRNVTTVNARAEELDDEFDYIVSRAVTTLDKFLSWVRKKYRKEIMYLKGGDVSEEIAAMMQRFRSPSGGVCTWRIDSWLHDPYYEGKLVICIEKNL